MALCWSSAWTSDPRDGEAEAQKFCHRISSVARLGQAVTPPSQLRRDTGLGSFATVGAC